MLKRVCLLIVMVWSLAILFTAEAAPLELGPKPVIQGNEYSISLFMDDKVLRNPNAALTGFLEIKPGMKLSISPVLDLWYSYSPTILPDISTMTVSVNGIPAESRRLVPDGAFKSNWQVALPLTSLREGINEITISVLHRSIEGLCKDIDNDANWFIIRPETTIKFKVDAMDYSLANFPNPFIDEYFGIRNNVVFSLVDLSENNIVSMLQLSSFMGRMAGYGAPVFWEARQEKPDEHIDANVITVGSQVDAGTSFSGDTAFLKLLPSLNGHYNLIAGGNDARGVKLAVNALCNNKFVRTLSGNETQFSLPVQAEKLSAKKALESKGVYTLRDIGYDDDILAAGAFHQEAEIFIPKPSNYDVEEGSYIELHFRHAKILDRKKSAVTIYVNEVPIRSEVLTAENADGGILKAELPVLPANQQGWRVRFAFYHDLGIIDCSKRYDDVAWSVIEKETSIYLAVGNRSRQESLADFPGYFKADSNGDIVLTMWLSQAPDDDELTVAAQLAYWIGQNNTGNIIWKVQNGANADIDNESGTVIIVGQNRVLMERNAVRGILPISIDADGTMKTSEWLNIAADAINQKNIFQVGHKNDNIIYAFTYADNENMKSFMRLAFVNGTNLNGQVALIDANGKTLTFAEEVKYQETGFTRILKSFSGNRLGSYLVVIAIVVGGTLALMWYSKRRK